MVPHSEWRWYGLFGHHICGRWCRFHLATEIGGYLVSTIGEYVPPSAGSSEQEEREWLKAHPYGDEIALDAKYETKVFRTDGKRCPCGCGQPDIEVPEVEGRRYNHPADATAGHYAMCDKWARIADGEEESDG